MKKFTTLVLLAFAFTAKAQVAEVVASGGGQQSASTISIEFTVGDIAVQPLSGGSLHLFEGFQAVNFGNTVITGLFSETALSFYPNPTQKFLTVEADFSPGATFRVTDMSGKQIDLPTQLLTNKAVVDVTLLPASLYILTIHDKSGTAYHLKFIKAL